MSVDGVWLDWTEWSGCSVTCGPGGVHNRARECEGPFYNGTDCEGDGYEEKDCELVECPGLWKELCVLCSITANLE